MVSTITVRIRQLTCKHKFSRRTHRMVETKAGLKSTVVVRCEKCKKEQVVKSVLK